jgi:hypothetical protein
MVVTYQQHQRMWKSPAALEAVIRDRAPAARRSGRVQEIEELWQLYRRYCQRPALIHEQAHA